MAELGGRPCEGTLTFAAWDSDCGPSMSSQARSLSVLFAKPETNRKNGARQSGAPRKGRQGVGWGRPWEVSSLPGHPRGKDIQLGSIVLVLGAVTQAMYLAECLEPLSRKGPRPCSQVSPAGTWGQGNAMKQQQSMPGGGKLSERWVRLRGHGSPDTTLGWRKEAFTAMGMGCAGAKKDKAQELLRSDSSQP